MDEIYDIPISFQLVDTSLSTNQKMLKENTITLFLKFRDFHNWYLVFHHGNNLLSKVGLSVKCSRQTINVNTVQDLALAQLNE